MVCRLAKSVMVAEGVTDTAIVVAEKGKSLLCLLSQLDTWCCFWDIVTSLRVKLLFLTTVSLVLLLTCFLDPLLILEEYGKQPGELVTVALISPPGLQPVSPLPLVNATIVAHALVDPWEQEERRIISKALHYPTLQVHHQAAAKEVLRRRKTDGLAEQESRLPQTSKPEGWEVELSGPLYWRHWAEFQKLLGEWADKKRFEPQVMEELLDQVKAPLDQYYYGSSSSEKLQQQSTQRYKTCAVVGNSGVLLRGSHGSFIDSHDMVIRINMAPLEGYTTHVGSRTNLSFINSNILHSCAKSSSCPCHLLGGAVPVAAYMCNPVHLMDIARCRNRRTVPLLVTDPRFDMLSYRIVKWYSLTAFAARTGHSIKQWNTRYGGSYFHYSSGFQAAMLALGMCENVDLFGFGKMPGVRHHYHSKQKEELSLHDYEAEYMFYDDVMHNRSASIPFLPDSGISVPPLRIFV